MQTANFIMAGDYCLELASSARAIWAETADAAAGWAIRALDHAPDAVERVKEGMQAAYRIAAPKARQLAASARKLSRAALLLAGWASTLALLSASYGAGKAAGILEKGAGRLLGAVTVKDIGQNDPLTYVCTLLAWFAALSLKAAFTGIRAASAFMLKGSFRLHGACAMALHETIRGIMRRARNLAAEL